MRSCRNTSLLKLPTRPNLVFLGSSYLHNDWHISQQESTWAKFYANVTVLLWALNADNYTMPLQSYTVGQSQYNFMSLALFVLANYISGWCKSNVSKIAVAVCKLQSIRTINKLKALPVWAQLSQSKLFYQVSQKPKCTENYSNHLELLQSRNTLLLYSPFSPYFSWI